MQIVTPEWLFERAGIVIADVVEWGEKPEERGPGVYVVTSTVPPPNMQPVVYIGRSNRLRRRLGEFYRHEYGNPAPHRGGQEILNRLDEKSVHWSAVKAYADAERAMLEAFVKVVGYRPFGNRIGSASMASNPT